MDDDGLALPRDGIAFGRVLARGPWVIHSYFKVWLLLFFPVILLADLDFVMCVSFYVDAGLCIWVRW